MGTRLGIHPNLSEECRRKKREKWMGKNNPRWSGGEVPCICKQCGKEFYIYSCMIKKGRGIFCSMMCRNTFYKKHPRELSEETKRKIGLASKGNTHREGQKATEATRKKMSETHKRIGTGKWMKDRKLPEKTKAKMRLRRGPKAANYQGGIYPLVKHIRKLFKYRQWRSDIFQRDDYTCQNCDVKGGILHAHHIKSFSSIVKEFNIKTIQQALDCEALWNINNGITFCKKCHRLEREIVKIEKGL